ncbi:MAG: lysophospholipid acyltransferase family protein [Chloroflexi bacterium]|nr:lysophospholipid acyltransferase family protein [Chloroflexota bacterium]MCL5075141.1 lysophospholipid acyltransferase family protein [Chloroflexota bacterium]
MEEQPKANRKEWWRRFIELANQFNLTYWVIRLSGFLARILPVRVSYAIVVSISYLIYLTWHRLRQTAKENIRQILGDGTDEKTIARLARSAFRNYFKYMVEFLRFPVLKKSDVERLICSSGWEHLDHALKEGKGAIFCGFHLGNWDLAGAAIALRGYPLNVIAETFQPQRLDELIQGQRMQMGMRIIPIEMAAKRIVRALRQNEVLALLIDCPAGENGVIVNFCGGQVTIPAGPALLALKTGAKLLPGYLIRQPDNTFHGAITPPVEVEPTGDIAKDIQVITQQLMNRLEEWVKQYPDQWFVFRQLWTHGGAMAQLVG